jgi:hypothetical protein
MRSYIIDFDTLPQIDLFVNRLKNETGLEIEANVHSNKTIAIRVQNKETSSDFEIFIMSGQAYKDLLNSIEENIDVNKTYVDIQSGGKFWYLECTD